MIQTFVDIVTNRHVGFIGGGGYLDIVASCGKGLVGVQSDEQEEACRDGIGGNARGEEIHPMGLMVGSGCIAIAEDESQPAATVSGEATQTVGIAGHAVRTVAEAEGLPHKPKATGGTQSHPGIGDGKDKNCDIEGCNAGRSGVTQDACRQSEEQDDEDEQVAVGLTAELELRETAAGDEGMDLLLGQRRYLRSDLFDVPLSGTQTVEVTVRDRQVVSFFRLLDDK